MLAAVINNPERVRIEDVPLPEPGPDEVRVRVEGCGVCSSNLPLWEGRPWFQYPLAPGAPGHEGWGRIDAAGRDVKGLSEGQRVALLSYHAYAEYDCARAAEVVALPPPLDGLPFPGEALGCAMNVFRRCRVQAGETVCIVGAGFLGILLAALSARAGARVLAVSRRASALAAARAGGADETFSLDDPARTVDAVTDRTRGAGCDCVIEATGLEQPLNVAAQLVRIRGRLVIAGYHQDGHRQVDLRLWNWRGIDVINAHERDPATYIEGIRAAVDAVVEGVFDLSRIASHRFPLAETDLAFRTATTRPPEFFKAWISP